MIAAAAVVEEEATCPSVAGASTKSYWGKEK